MRRTKNLLSAALPALLLAAQASAETRWFTDFGLTLCGSSGAGVSNCTELSGGEEIRLTGATRRDARGRGLYEVTTKDGAVKGWISESERKTLLKLDREDRAETFCTQNPQIGMSEEEVLSSCWGKPRSRRRTGVEGLMRDEWIYGDGRYLYFDNGRLFAIQQ